MITVTDAENGRTLLNEKYIVRVYQEPEEDNVFIKLRNEDIVEVTETIDVIKSRLEGWEDEE